VNGGYLLNPDQDAPAAPGETIVGRMMDPELSIEEPADHLVAWAEDGTQYGAEDALRGGGTFTLDDSHGPDTDTFTDCNGTVFNNDDCVEDWGYPCLDGVGDGTCDDGSAGPNFNCAEYNYDGGDCSR
jgi:hypothetical protein